MRRFMLLVLVALSTWMLTSCEESNSVDSIIKDKSKCFVMSQDFVKLNLKYPAEATFDFPFYHEVISSNTATVLSKVTTKNGFGVKVEIVYKILLEFKGGEWTDINNWKQLDIKLE